jgi:hypothetical protein
LLSAACSIIFHHHTAPINGWLLFFVGCLSPMFLPSAHVIVGHVLPHYMSAKSKLPGAILLPDGLFWFHWQPDKGLLATSPLMALSLPTTHFCLWAIALTQFLRLSCPWK